MFPGHEHKNFKEEKKNPKRFHNWRD